MSPSGRLVVSVPPSGSGLHADVGSTPTPPGARRSARALAWLSWAVVWTACGPGTPPPAPRTVSRPCPARPCPARPAPRQAPLGLLGTADFLEVQTASPEADWAVICQARTDTDRDGQVSMHTDRWGALYGDRPVPYFIQGAGPGEPLDAYILRDTTGRFLLVVKDGRLLLLDTRSETATDLSARGAPVGPDGYPFLGHAGASFDAKGTRLLYLHGTPDRRVAVVRDLTTGAEIRVPSPPRALRQATLHHGGRWVMQHADPAPDRHCTFYRSEQPTGARRFCPGRDDQRHVLDRDQFPCTDLWISPVDGSAPPREAHDVVLISEDFLVIRDKDGALRMKNATQDRVLVPATCRAQVLAAADSPLAMLVACAGPGPNVRLVTTAGPRPLPLVAAPRGTEAVWIDERRLPRLETAQGAVYVDLDGRPTRILREDGNLVARHGRLALFQERNRWRLWNVDTGRRILTIEGVPEYAPVFTAGSQVAVGRSGDWPGVVIDLAEGRLTGRLPRKLWALSRQGFALVEGSGEGAVRASGRVRGPLMWLAPVPADTRPGDEPLYRYFWLTPPSGSSEDHSTGLFPPRRHSLFAPRRCHGTATTS